MELKNFYAQDVNGNILPGAACSLYLPGTTTLVTGLQDSNGKDLANPFTADTTGLIAFAAPNGSYDLYTVMGARTGTIRVQFIDVDKVASDASAAAASAKAAQDAFTSGTSLIVAEAQARQSADADIIAQANKDRLMIGIENYVASGLADSTSGIQSAIDYLQSKGGGILMFTQGYWRFTSLKTDGTVSFYGLGAGISTLVHVPVDSNSDGIVYTPTKSFLRPALNQLTYLCEGEGRYGVTTPLDGGQFTRAFAIDFAGMSIRRSTSASLGWAGSLRLGDMVASSFKRSEIRMGFDVSADPSTQKDTAGVILEAATANIAADLTGLQIVGCKYPVRIGENVEGYFLTNSELVNCLDGISSYNTNSKPGGFHSNLHVNAARYPVALQNRRDFNIDGIQLYRGSGHFNGTTAWVGFKMDTCSRFEIKGQNFRVVTGYSSKSNAYQFTNCTDGDVGTGVLGEDAGITDGITLSSCKAFSVGLQKMATGMSTWLTMTSCSFVDVGKMVSQDATVPTTAYSIDATNAKRNIKVDRTDLDRLGYEEITYTAAATKVIQFTDGTPVRTLNLNAGSAAYTVDIQILRANHLPGMTYRFRVVMAASTNPTIRFLDDSTSNIRRTIAGTSSQAIYEVELVFNNAGWVIYSVQALAA